MFSLFNKLSNKKRRNKLKAQIFTADAIIAAGIFILILISAAYAWDYSREKAYLTDKRDYMEMAARGALSGLIETSGNPSDWHTNQDYLNTSYMKSLGLAKNRPWHLSAEKIQAMQDWYPERNETFKRLLGLQGLNLHMEFWVYDSGFAANADYVIGSSPGSGIRNIVRLQRTGLFQNDTGDYWLKIVLEIWENE